MILEVAILSVIPGQEETFMDVFSEAQHILEKMRGYLGHELQRCLEKKEDFLLFVHWDKIENHTQGFHQSAEYQEWKNLLHHFYQPFPRVNHYELIFKNKI